MTTTQVFTVGALGDRTAVSFVIKGQPATRTRVLNSSMVWAWVQDLVASGDLDPIAMVQVLPINNDCPTGYLDEPIPFTAGGGFPNQ